MAQAKAGSARRRTTGSGGRRASGRAGGAVRAKPEGTPEPARPLCGFALCPICTALTALGESRPELLEHVVAASREVLLSVRALIDARLEGADDPSGPRLERLSIG